MTNLPLAVPFIGTSQTSEAYRREIAFVARTEAKVLVTGESGVGKGVVARLIHANSERNARPLLSVNCVGVPDTLLESELFGHTRGSFTGAHRDHLGLLRQADGGTIVLDGIDHLSERLQQRLSRFLETSDIQRAGPAGARAAVDVRMVAATSRDLPTRIAEGAFREDLYYRLNVIRVDIAPLRDRRDDIEPLMRHFVAQFSHRYNLPVPALSPAAVSLLESHRWPGNAREMRDVAERVVARKLAVVDAKILMSVMGLTQTTPAELT